MSRAPSKGEETSWSPWHSFISIFVKESLPSGHLAGNNSAHGWISTSPPLSEIRNWFWPCWAALVAARSPPPMWGSVNAIREPLGFGTQIMQRWQAVWDQKNNAWRTEWYKMWELHSTGHQHWWIGYHFNVNVCPRPTECCHAEVEGENDTNGGGHVRPGQGAKKRTGLVICTVRRSAQNRPDGPFRSNMAATLAQLGSTSARMTPTSAQLADLAPTSAQLGSKMAHLGPKVTPIWEQLQTKLTSIWLQMGGIAGPIRNLQNARFHLYFPSFFAIDGASFEARFSMLSPLGPTWCEDAAKARKLRHVRIDLDFHAHRMASIWNPSMTNWRQLGCQLGPRQRNLGPSLGQVGPPKPSWAQLFNPSQFCGLNATRWKLAFLPLFPTFFGFDGVSCEAMLPMLGLCWAQLRGQMPPHRTKLRMCPTCVQTCPSCAMLDPSWAPVGRKFYAQLGPKWAPVRPNFRPRTAEFDPVGFWLGQVGPLLSSPSNFLGAGGSHREATRIIGKWVRDDRNERLT